MHNEGQTIYREIPLSVSTWRLVPSRYPTIKLFEDILDPKDLEAAYALESLTNDRYRDEVGELSLVTPEDRICGQGTSPIMAAFTHLNENGSRFSDGSYGVYYAALDLETAIKETIYHREIFLKTTNEKPQIITMRCYKALTNANYVDLRDNPAFHTDDYSVTQIFGKRYRQNGHQGIYYKSVRNPAGECIGAFKPKAIQPTIQCAHYGYVWDGHRITDYYEKGVADC